VKKRWIILLAIVLLLAGLWLYARQVLFPQVTAWPALNGELEVYSLQHDGRERRYHVYRPASLTRKPPLLLVFHGSMSDGLSMRDMGARQFDRLADEQGFLLVYPDGFERHWNDCRATASYTANTVNIDDVGFVRRLVDVLAANAGIDRQRVYATGLSNGGHMALRLALEAPDLVAGVAPMASNLPVANTLDCKPSGEPVNVALVAGTHDPVNPYAGGLVKILWDDSRGVVESAQQTAEYFARLAGYTGAPMPGRLPDSELSDDSTISVQQWRGQEKQVALYTLEGGGHIFPSRHTRFGKLLGGDNRDVDAADLVWEFFTDAQ